MLEQHGDAAEGAAIARAVAAYGEGGIDAARPWLFVCEALADLRREEGTRQ